MTDVPEKQFTAPAPDSVSAVEQKKLLPIQEQLQVLIRTISARQDLIVTTEIDPKSRMTMMSQGQNPETEWFYYRPVDRKTGKVLFEYVHIPKEILEASEDEAMGKAAHEAGHVLITRYRHFAPRQILEQELGFSATLAAAEERPTDEVVRVHRPSAGVMLDNARRRMLNEGEEIARLRPEARKIPRFAQLGLLMVYAPYYDKPPEFFVPEVVAAYQEIKRDVEEMEKNIPARGAKEKEVMKKAKERYRDVYLKIWPAVRELVKKDQEEEKARQTARELRNPEEKKTLEKLTRDLQEELKKELEKLFEDLCREEEHRKMPKNEVKKEERGSNEKGENKVLKGKEEDEGNEKDGKDDEQEETKKQEAKETEKSKVAEIDKNGEAAQGQKHEANEEVDGEMKQLAGEKEGEKPAMPLARGMSEALLRALKQAFDSLPAEKQQKIIDAARRRLEDIEDEMTREMSGHLTDTPSAVHEQMRLRLEDAKQQAEKTAEELEEQKRREEIKEELEERKRLAELEKGKYEKTYAEVHNLEEQLYQELLKILKPNLKSGMRLKLTGARTNLPALFRWKSAKAGGAKDVDAKIFETIQTPETRDYAFSILIDLSGSMEWEGKIEETFKALIILMEVLNRLGIKFEVRGFSTSIINLKKIDERMDNGIRESIARMVYPRMATFIADALSVASQSLDEFSAKYKIIIVLTDGNPSDPAETIGEIAKIVAKGGQQIIGLGLGAGTDLVTEYFPVSMPNIPVGDFPRVLSELLKDTIINPQKYRSAVKARAGGADGKI